ncbi:MAG TPA: hypothetical protein V6D17_12785 [Candidatus Obscuribacterales bacterium]
MVTLQVVPGPQGQDCVVTPKGMVVPLPGAGVDGNTVQIFMGAQGGYWYIDKNGQPVDLTAAVKQFQSATAKASEVPQYAPVPSQTTSSGAAAATAAAAGLGAMAGAAMTNAYYNNVPYGTPMYYPRTGNPYYVNASGNAVYVQPNNSVNYSTYNAVHAENLQKQEDWYSSHKNKNTDQFKKWKKNSDDNPFVAANSARFAGDGDADGQRRFGRRGGGDALGSDGGGRFGRRGGGDASGSDGGGRFGRRGGGDASSRDGGGRFGRRGGEDASSSDGGGRLGRRGGEDGDKAGGRLGGRRNTGGGALQQAGDGAGLRDGGDSPRGGLRRR